MTEPPAERGPYTWLPFTPEELKLAGDACDTTCKALEAVEKFKLDPDLNDVKERWVKFNSLRTFFREAQYGAETRPAELPADMPVRPQLEDAPDLAGDASGVAVPSDGV